MQGRIPHGTGIRPLVSLVLPGYNPGSGVETTWREVRRFLNLQPDNWEIIFVCDGSTDGSTERLQELARDEPERVRVLSYLPNRGKGYAVRQGLLAAGGAWRIFTDIDLAYGWDDVLTVANSLRRGAELVIASREHPESRITLPASLQGYIFRRHLQSRLFVGLAHLLLPFKHRDPQAGLKGMSARVADLVLPHLQCNGFCMDCELLTACIRFGIPMTEVPVNVRYEDVATTTGFASVLNMVKELWRIRKRWRRTPTLAAPVPVHETREAA